MRTKNKNMHSNAEMILQTKVWITNVVIGCNFCPFAAKEVKRNTILYEVCLQENKEEIIQELLQIFIKMDADENVETAFLILPNGLEKFTNYLEIVFAAEDFLAQKKYEGIYQLASFHPEYLFAGAKETDAENYTNRSPFPMIHILREDSLTKAIDNHPNVDLIPQNNIDFAKSKGLEWMKRLSSPNPPK